MEKPALHICVLGAATSNHTLTRATIFQEFGHQISLITPTEGKKLDGVAITACPRGAKGGFLGKLDWLKSVFKAVAKSKADVFHAHYAAELTTWAAAFLGKKPLVITVMGGDVLFDEQGSLGPVGRWLTKYALKKADLVTVKSALLEKTVKGFGVDPAKIQHVVWGVDHRAFSNNPVAAQKRREKWQIPEDRKILFSPRMLTPFYNQNLMIDVLSTLLPLHPNLQLVMSTYNEDTDYRGRLIKQAQEINVIDHLTFVPAESSYEMAASYAAADLIISLPPSDGTPQSVMEAMACHTPVIMTDLERYREFFDHKETAWFTSLKVDEITTSVDNLLNDPKLCQNMCDKAALKVKAVADLQAQASMVNDAYYRLINV